MVKKETIKTSPTPLNQGNQGTCVPNAVTQIVVGIVKTKYGVPLNENNVLELMKDRVGKFAGTTEEKVCKCWNKKPPRIEDIDKSNVYQFEITTTEVSDFEEAYESIGKFRGTCSASMEYDKGEHAVAAFDAYARPFPLGGTTFIRAVNSWGASHPYIDISPRKFLRAWVFDVNIICKECDGKSVRIPSLTLYASGLKWQWARQKKAEARQKEAEAELDAAHEAMLRRLRKGDHVSAADDISGKGDEIIEEGTQGEVTKVFPHGQVRVRFANSAHSIKVKDLSTLKFVFMLSDESSSSETDSSSSS